MEPMIGQYGVPALRAEVGPAPHRVHVLARTTNRTLSAAGNSAMVSS